MKVKITQSAFKHAIDFVQGAVSEKNLGQFGLYAYANTLRLVAADRFMIAYTETDAEVMQSGFISLPARFFTEMVRELPHGAVRLERDGGQVDIWAGESEQFHLRLPVISDEGTWYEKPQMALSPPLEISTATLSHLIDQVFYCLEEETNRDFAKVVYIHRTGPKKLRFVATDGYRFALSEFEGDLPLRFIDDGICVSRRTLAELRRVCQLGVPTVKLANSADRTTLLATVDRTELFIRLSSVEFPDYSEVIPEIKAVSLKLATQQVQAMCRRILLASGKSKFLYLDLKANQLAMSGWTSGTSEGKETLEIDGYRGPECRIAVHGKHLIDVFSVIPSEKVQIRLKGPTEPIIIQSDSEPLNCLSQHIIVPIEEVKS